ncbi:c-type cytochrome [Paracidobacterium acidisoli]|nr:cytochrome c [Paracidobacterium acidisoli]MBT9330773.1 cytochrome c [Paracidobacterium acidisoli]
MRRVFHSFSPERVQHIVLCALVSAGMILLASTTGFAAAGSGEPAGGPAAKRGDAIFHQRCVTCHNKEPGNTSPFGPPNLHGIFRDKVLTPPQAESIIRQGKGGMPTFGKILTPSQISDVVAYLKTQ